MEEGEREAGIRWKIKPSRRVMFDQFKKRQATRKLKENSS